MHCPYLFNGFCGVLLCSLSVLYAIHFVRCHAMHTTLIVCMMFENCIFLAVAVAAPFCFICIYQRAHTTLMTMTTTALDDRMIRYGNNNKCLIGEIVGEMSHTEKKTIKLNEIFVVAGFFFIIWFGSISVLFFSSLHLLAADRFRKWFPMMLLLVISFCSDAFRFSFQFSVFNHIFWMLRLSNASQVPPIKATKTLIQKCKTLFLNVHALGM